MSFNTTVFVILLVLIISSCSLQEKDNSSRNYLSRLPEFVTPDDPGMIMYRNVLRTPSWEFKPVNPIDWNTALHTWAYGVNFDDEGRIIQVVSFWRGRKTDVLLIKQTAPAVTIEYLDDGEIISLLYADGARYNEYDYLVQRDEEGFGITQYFLDESGNHVSADGVAYLHLEPQAESWYSLTSMDETGNPVITRFNPVIKYRLNENGCITAYEHFDSLGNNVLNDKYCYRFEIEYDENSNSVERRWLNQDGIPEEDMYHSAWETLDVSEEGLLLAIHNLDSQGNVSENGTGRARIQFQHDQYGRITNSRYFDLQGEPVLISGVWDTETKYDDQYQIHSTMYLDAEGNPVNSTGIAEMVSVFDSIGNPVEAFYWDADGEPALNWNGVHWHKFSFDEHCRLVEMSSWNPDGSPGLTSYGAHIEKYIKNADGSDSDYQRYDENNELIEQF